MSVLIRVVPQASGAWRVSAGLHDQSPVEGVAPAGLIEEALRLSEALERSAKLPGDDAALSQLEEELGQALAATLYATGELSRVCGDLLCRGKQDGRVPLIVDAAGPLGALPWELIADAPDGDPFEGADLGWVVRRAPAGQPYTSVSTAGFGLRQLRWCTAEAASCARLISGLSGLARRLSPIRSVDLDPEALPSSEDGWADLLHLVLYGADLSAQLDEALSVLGGPGGLLRSARLVVVHVCDPHLVDFTEHSALGNQVIAAGAAACLSPRRAVGEDAVRAFTSGLYDALISGRPSCEAVVAGRRRVRALQVARPETRWHNLVLTVSSSLQPQEAPFLHGNLWLPRGWPNPGTSAAALLRRARELANDHGYVGIDHVALAMEDMPPSGPWTERLRSFLARHRRELAQRAEGLKLRFPRMDSDWSGTPRLQRFAEALPQDFSVEDLWRVMLADIRGPLHALWPSLSLPSQKPLPVPEGWGRALAEELEVVGGPEDGRVLPLGATVGRWNQFGAQMADALLYDGTARYDASLSRSALLRWQGRGMVELAEGRDAGLTRFTFPGWLADDELTDHGEEAPLIELARGGERAVMKRGDLLALTPLTRLRAC